MTVTTRKVNLILASSSPRRRQLLTQAGFEFKVVAPPISEPDETFSVLSPRQQAEALAYFKCRAVADRHRRACVLAADTVVELNGRILGKPAGRTEAGEMLRSLSGTRHAVITGVALLGPGAGRLIASETTYVTMRRMTEEEIEDYVASGEWSDKAGAYAIQETADRFVEKIEGSFTNVVGLPIELVERMIVELDEHPEAHKAI